MGKKILFCTQTFFVQNIIIHADLLHGHALIFCKCTFNVNRWSTFCSCFTSAILHNWSYRGTCLFVSQQY